MRASPGLPTRDAGWAIEQAPHLWLGGGCLWSWGTLGECLENYSAPGPQFLSPSWASDTLEEALVRSGCGAATPPWGGPPGCQQTLREQGTQGLLLEDGTRVSGPHTWQRAALRPPVHLSRMEGCSSSLGDSATSTGSLDLCPGEHNQQ